MPGSGKSGLMKKVALYLAERNLYPGGILYVNLSGIDCIFDALTLILQRVEYALDNPLKRTISLRKAKS